MSTENSKKSLSLVEVMAVAIFLIGISIVFVSRSEIKDHDREIRNALRYQDVSSLADAFWKLSIQSTDYSARSIAFVSQNSCSESGYRISEFSDLMVPNYFDVLPQDPKGQEYLFSIDTNGHVTVCSPYGEDSNNQLKTISITR